MTIQKIPLFPQTSDQTLTVELDGNPYGVRVTWNERFGYWSLSLYTVAGDPLVEGIKMVTNYDLTSRFKDERMPYGALYFVREKGPYKRPGYDDLAVTHALYYYSPDSVVTAQSAYGQSNDAVTSELMIMPTNHVPIPLDDYEHAV